MNWEEVDVLCGFGGGEETARFGPRQETGSSLYQVDTVACVNNKGVGKGIPWMLSNGCMEKIALVLEKNILVFDESCSEHLCSFVADSLIDAVGWSQDGSFLVYADRSGCLSLSHITSQQVLFTKQIISQEQTDNKPCFVSVSLFQCEKGLYEFIIVSREGKGFQFSAIDLDSLNDAVTERNVEKASEIQSKIKLKIFDITEVHTVAHFTTFTVDRLEKSALIAGNGEYGISEWAITDENIFINNFCQHYSEDVGFKKVLLTPDEQYVVALDTANHLNLYSHKGFVLLETWCDRSVDDFILFVTSSVDTDREMNSKAREELKIVLLTKPQKLKRDLIVVSLPHFEHVYTLQVSASAALATLPCQQDTIMFVEGVDSEDLDDSMDEIKEKLYLNVSTVRLRCLMEALPENQFSRLLHKKKFQEAEEFAKTFNLDIQLVYKVKSYYLLDQVALLGVDSGEDFKCLIEELKQCLNKTEDMEHLVKCCLQAQLPTLNETYDLLNYAREKVDFEARTFTKSSDIFQTLLDGINRLVTFEIAFGARLFSGAIWSAFLSSSLLDEVIKCFRETDISSGIIIWRRHQSEFKAKFSLQKLEQVLNSIPKNTPSKKIISWLRQDFVPFVLTVLPSGQSLLAVFLENTARGLEFSEKEQWPNNALELAEVMYTAFSSVSQSTQNRGIATPMQFATKVCKLSIPFFDSGSDPNMTSVGLSSAMKKLGNLVKSLREVKALHHEYNCKLSLDQFCLEDTKTIAFRLLNRIAAAELIPHTIKNYVKPYVLKNNLKLDKLLYEYICELVDVSNQVASLWEPKVIAIINEIEKKESRCEATLKLMLKARTPWSGEVESLVADQMQSNPENEKLKKQFCFAAVRKTMARYGIRDTNLADISRIWDIIKHMFSTGNPEALEDSLQICKHFPYVTTSFIYYLCVRSWIARNEDSKVCQLLQSIPAADAKEVAELALNWVDNTLSWQPVDQEDSEEKMQTAKAVLMIITTVSMLDKSYKKELEISNVVEILRNIHRLQQEFGVFLTFYSYGDEDYKIELIKEYYTSPFAIACFPHKKNSNKTFNVRINRFAKLLGFTDAALQDILFSFYKDNENLEKAFQIAYKLTTANDSRFKMHPSHQHSSLLVKIVYYLITTDHKDVCLSWLRRAENMHYFVTQALLGCVEGCLADYLLLSKLMRISAAIVSQCESSDYQDDPKKIDGYLNQMIEDQYKDDSLVLSSKDVFPIFKQLFTTCLSEVSLPLNCYESHQLSGKGLSYIEVRGDDGSVSYSVDTIRFSKIIQALVNMLLENNHQEMALHLIQLGISSCAQHAANLQVGLSVPIATNDAQDEKEKQVLELELNAAQMILTKGNSLVTECASNLVKSVLSHRVVDHDLALCYLDVLSTNKAVSLLSQMKTKFGSKYSRIQVIAKVGVELCSLRLGLTAKLKKSFQDLQVCAFWGRTLQGLCLPPGWNIYSVIEDEDEKKKILHMLVQHKSIDIDAIISYCKSFSYDEEHAILMYIECLLFTSNRVILSTETIDKEKVDKCIEMYVQAPYTLSKLEALLTGMIIKINPYDYERLIYTFRKIADISQTEHIRCYATENVFLLEMLTLYERTATDIDYNVECSVISDEMEDEQILHGKSSLIPELAKKRLPFHSLAKKGVTWQVLNPELTSEKNLILLTPILNKLKFDTDQMFAKAVQNIASKELAKKGAKEEQLAPFDFSLVENILNMIQKDTLMMATAKWVAKQLPRGTEKAKVLKVIVERSKALVGKCNTREAQAQAMITYSRFNDVYKRVSIEAALLEHNINDEKFFMLCNQPAKLICELYEEYGDRVRFETGKMTGAPEIHSVAKKITEISGDIDLEKIIIYLVTKWLPSIRGSSGNEDYTDIMTVSSDDKVKRENEKNLRRVIYLLASSYNCQTVKLLLNYVYQSEEQNTSNVYKIRALQVLFKLVDCQTIEQEAQIDMNKIHEKLLSCIYLSELEKLHISHSEEAFNKANKESLVKGLWRNHSHEPQGIRLISDICLDFQIFDPQLWNSLLVKLLSFDMIPYLTQVLVTLSGIPQLREIPSLTKMWRAVVTAPFLTVACPLSPEEEESCLQAAQLLTRCPVILDIGLPEIAGLMKKAGLFTHAIFCMKLIPNLQVKKDSIQSLLDDVGIDVILSKVKKNRDQGLMDSHLDQVEEEVFNYVNEHNLFKTLFGTEYFSRLIGYLIRSNKVNKLLMKTISAGRLSNALELIQLYLSVHTTSPFAERVLANNLDLTQALKVYLEIEGLLVNAKQYLNPLFNDTLNEMEMPSNFHFINEQT